MKTASELVEAVAQVGMSIHREPREIAQDCIKAIVDALGITEAMVDGVVAIDCPCRHMGAKSCPDCLLTEGARDALSTLLAASRGEK